MRRIHGWAILLTFGSICSGCASPMAGTVATGHIALGEAAESQLKISSTDPPLPTSRRSYQLTPAWTEPAQAQDTSTASAIRFQHGGDSQEPVAQATYQSQFEPSQGSTEEVPRPDATYSDTFKPGLEETDPSRLNRVVDQISTDIRPLKGEMPEDLAAAQWSKLPADHADGANRDFVTCSWTPWTICYRPLYFQDIELERYGLTHGIWQPAFSGGRFFIQLGTLPGRMIFQPPRSCVCTNGFSRVGDMPLMVTYIRGNKNVILPKPEEIDLFGPAPMDYFGPQYLETVPAVEAPPALVPAEAPGPDKNSRLESLPVEAPAVESQPIGSQPVEDPVDLPWPDEI